MERPPVGSVVTVEVPYPDATGSKRRPALVVSHASEHECFLLEITSQPKPFPLGIIITDADFQAGRLSRSSQVRADRIFTAHVSLFGKVVGALSDDRFQEIVRKTLSLFPVQSATTKDVQS